MADSDNLHQFEGMDANRLAKVALYTNNGVVITDEQGVIEWVNPSFERITGYTLAEVRGKRPGDFLQGEESSTATVAYMRQCLRKGQGFDVEILNYTRDGKPVWLQVNCTALAPAGKARPGYAAVLRDISARKSSERRLRIAASVFERSHEAIMISDRANRIIDVNPAFSRIIGYQRDEIIGQNPSILSSGRHTAEFYHALWEAINVNNHWRGEIWNRRKNGEEYPELLSITRVHLDEPGQWHHVAVFSDITTLKNHAEELDRATHYDSLTNLPNRQLLLKRLRRAMEHAIHNDRPLAVCYLDLDGLKSINDRFGRNGGDRVLTLIADRLRTVIRSEDTVARIAADEFVLLLQDVTDDHAFQRILDVVNGPAPVGPATLRLTASMGITFYPNDATDADRLVRHADQAMLAAKEKGRNQWAIFDPALDEHRKKRRKQLMELTRALDDGEFRLHYQPQIRMCDRAVVGFEALIRWQHPKRGQLAPADFLPAVEGSHLEVPIAQWVLREALSELGRWSARGEAIAVSVNISAAHLLDRNFTEFLQRYLMAHPEINPALIHLEVLESTALDDMQRAGHVIEQCRAMGLQVALDDFGTGFSSLTYFRALPVDLIKMDQSFVRSMLSDPADRAIVESVIFLAKRFGRPVLAEGVETLEHARALRTLGCEMIQGYGVARPMPAEDIAGWLEQWRQSWPVGGRDPFAVMQANDRQFNAEESGNGAHRGSPAARDGTPSGR